MGPIEKIPTNALTLIYENCKIVKLIWKYSFWTNTEFAKKIPANFEALQMEQKHSKTRREAFKATQLYL